MPPIVTHCHEGFRLGNAHQSQFSVFTIALFRECAAIVHIAKFRKVNHRWSRSFISLFRSSRFSHLNPVAFGTFQFAIISTCGFIDHLFLAVNQKIHPESSILEFQKRLIPFSLHGLDSQEPIRALCRGPMITIKSICSRAPPRRGRSGTSTH